jgi:hypothetical protein
MDLKAIYKRMTPVAKGDIIGSVIAGICESKKNPDMIPVKIVFVKDRNSKNWLALLSTDTDIENEEITRVYGKRWDIEVFFKMTKSYLDLAKEFQGRSYDQMIAHTAIVFMRYIMLAWEFRQSNYLKTIGDLFYYMCDEVDDIKLSMPLFLILDLLKKILVSFPAISEEIAHMIIDTFKQNLPTFWRQKLKLVA